MRVLVTGGSGFIGTNLTQSILDHGWSLCNVDIAPPKVKDLGPFWEQCDILDRARLKTVFQKFQPDVVIHLAAETDTDPSKTLADYRVNVQGTKNLLEVIEASSTVKRSVFTSTQFVHQGKNPPRHDQDFAPHTIYGESKVSNEKDVRAANLTCAWTIIRPTNIWGPWHLRYPSEFWRILSRGLYVHPGLKPVMRSYGYVGNVVWQIIKMIESEKEVVDRQVFYVGDAPIDLFLWVNGFSIQQTGKSVRVVPRSLVRLAALVGDGLRLLGIGFPITSSRYRSMTESNPAPMEKTLETFGVPPFSLDQGIGECVAWMKHHHPQLVTRL